ncbi:MAG TPA: hypothetical protein VFC03_12700 [Acidimicrobiales bacterium]|nr:hypothetical protein [Acidimicrobiales bacterium]
MGDDLFAPEDTVTREEAAAIISRWVAAKNGYDLDTMYGESEIDAILGGFGDPSHVGPDLREEMAFSIDFGILRGNASGDLDAKGNLTRIQGGAMLIRSWALVPPEPEDPEEEPVVPADIELVSDGEAEHLIGLMGQNTFKVTQEDGSAAPNVLVDFDTLSDAGYVGSIWPQAALTDEEGELTVSVTSTEIGIQSISAAVPGVSAVYATKYWLALDEVYILDEGATAPEEADEEVGSEATARNDAGSDHEWEARVVVFGPGPLSTDRQDFYNTVNPDGDPADPTAEDGVSYALNDYSDELELREETGRIARTVAGVPVFWSISVDSAGEMVRAGHDPDIAEDGRSAWAYTNDGGLTDAVIDSEVAGTTTVTVSADYQGNPYEGLLLNRNLYMGTDDDHGQGENGEEQPGTEATDGTFRPGAAISRQQMNSILARHISEKEIEAKGSVKGVVRNYPSLQAWHEAEGSFYLGGFNEANQVAAVHRPGTAYLVYHKVVQGSADFGALHLKAVLGRDQDLPGEHPAHRLHRRLR